MQEIEAVTITFEFAVRDGLARINGYAFASVERAYRNHVPDPDRSDVRDQEVYTPRRVDAPAARVTAVDVEATPMTRCG